MEQSTIFFLRFSLDFLCHLGEAPMKIMRQIQRVYAHEMIDKPKMVQHDPPIPPFTSYVHLNNLQQFLPFVFQVIPRNVLLPNNALELWIKERSKFNVFNGSGIEPPLTLSRNLSCYNNTCLIYLHFQRTQLHFGSIKCFGKCLYNSLMIPL